MRALVGRVVFRVGERPYLWEDVLLAAGVWGEWAGLRRRTESGLMLQTRPGARPVEGECESAAEEFRYDKDLLSADDLDAWLAGRGLGVGDWLAAVRRAVLLRDGQPRRVTRTEPKALATPLLADLVYQGDLDRLAVRLSHNAVAGNAGAGHLTAIARRACEEIAPVLGLPQRACFARGAHIAALGRSFDRFATEATLRNHLAREVADHKIAWLRFRIRRCTVATSGQANELALLVRHDGLPLSEAAPGAGVACREAREFLDELPIEIRDLALGAEEGDLIGPVAIGESFEVAQIMSRSEPSLRDPAVKRRAETAALATAVERAMSGRVRWEHRAGAGVST